MFLFENRVSMEWTWERGSTTSATTLGLAGELVVFGLFETVLTVFCGLTAVVEVVEVVEVVVVVVVDSAGKPNEGSPVLRVMASPLLAVLVVGRRATLGTFTFGACIHFSWL